MNYRLAITILSIIFADQCMAHDANDNSSRISNDINLLRLDIGQQVDDLQQLFDDYRKMAYDVDKTIRGLDTIALHYNKLSNSLLKTKRLIEKIGITYNDLISENEKLQRIAKLPPKDLDDFLDYQRSKNKWYNRKEGYLISLFASFTVAFLLGGLSFWKLYNKIKKSVSISNNSD